MKLHWLLVPVAALALGVGCKKDDKKNLPADPPAKKAEAPAEVPEPEVEPEVAEAELAVVADFEEESEKDITAKNFSAELDKLAKEIETEDEE